MKKADSLSVILLFGLGVQALKQDLLVIAAMWWGTEWGGRGVDPNSFR